MDLVTGGTGLIGSHVLLELVRRKRPVRALKRESSRLDIVKRVFQFYHPDEGMALFSGIEWMDGDLSDIDAMMEAMSGVERVFHCAGMVSYDPRDRDRLLELNVEGTRNLVNVALHYGVEAFGHLSSTSALGKAREGEPLDESAKWTVDHRNSDYSVSKFMAEREVWRAREEGLPVVIVNPCIVLGAGDPGRSSTTLIGGVAEGNPFYPPGSNAFIDVRDVAEPLVDLLDGMEHEGERYVLIGEHRSFQEVMERVAEKIGQRPPRFRAGRFLLETTWRTEHLLRSLSGRKPRISKHTARNGLRNMRFSAKKAQRDLGLSPRPIDNAIENAASFYLELQKEKAL